MSAQNNSIKNGWSKIVRMLGIKLNQKFYLADKHGIDKNHSYVITEKDGIMVEAEGGFKQAPVEIINGLINGSISIYTDFKPAFGELYHFLMVFPVADDDYTLSIESMPWRNCFSDFLNYSIGNVFRTAEEANMDVNVNNVMKKYREMYKEYHG